MASMWAVFGLSAVAAFADLFGGMLTVIRPLRGSKLVWMTGLGAGFLFGATVLDRLPSTMQVLPQSGALYITVGYLVLLLIDGWGMRTHVHVAPAERESFAIEHSPVLMSKQAMLLALVGLIVHTFMDGVVIAGAFSISRSTGILMFIAITLHKIPEGFSMGAISLASGTTRKSALLSSTALAVSTLLGAFITLQLGTADPYVVKVLMALATGTFLYISTSDMIPAVKEQHRQALFATVLGAAIFYGSLVLVTRVGLG
ncbi:MAG: ZIP family metal transporter [Alicyclobacillus sp.]|nr:ZIP family metal transporter [Alicyclobacillus sp.]